MHAPYPTTFCRYVLAGDASFALPWHAHAAARIKTSKVGHTTPDSFRENASPFANPRVKRRVVGPTLVETDFPAFSNNLYALVIFSFDEYVSGVYDL